MFDKVSFCVYILNKNHLQWHNDQAHLSAGGRVVAPPSLPERQSALGYTHPVITAGTRKMWAQVGHQKQPLTLFVMCFHTIRRNQIFHTGSFKAKANQGLLLWLCWCQWAGKRNLCAPTQDWEIKATTRAQQRREINIVLYNSASLLCGEGHMPNLTAAELCQWASKPQRWPATAATAAAADAEKNPIDSSSHKRQPDTDSGGLYGRLSCHLKGNVTWSSAESGGQVCLNSFPRKVFSSCLIILNTWVPSLGLDCKW